MDDNYIDDADAFILYRIVEDSCEQSQEENRIGIECPYNLVGEKVIGKP